ncbi:MAG: hypothetical protein RLY93_16555, partial [Sumerlaeia bacterium]
MLATILKGGSTLVAAMLFAGSVSAGWEEVPVQTEGSGDFTSIDFVDDSLGFAMRAKGFDWELYRTQDGGDTWTVLASGEEDADSSRGVAEVDFFSATNGWMWFGSAFDGPLLRTTDGGVTWTPVETPLSTAFGPEVVAAHFFDDNTGIIAGDGRDADNARIILARTDDAGATWQPVYTPSRFDAVGIDFRDSLVGGVTGGAGSVLTTVDGGMTWSAPNTNISETWGIIHYSRTTSQAWVGGELGSLMQSDDSGQTFLSASPRTTGRFDQLYHAPDGTLYVSGEVGPSGLFYVVDPERGRWFLDNVVTFTSQGIRYPNTVLAIVEKPDGTLYAGGRRMMRLANST